MIRDTICNFLTLESVDYGLDAFESKFHPDLDLVPAITSHIVLNGTFALQGHFSKWERPGNSFELAKTIALPIFTALGASIVVSALQKRSITNGITDCMLHASFFALYRIYFHYQEYNPQYQWYNQVLMGGSFVLGALTLAKKCARYALQHLRDPKFPWHIQCGYEVAKSLTTYTFTQLADKYEWGMNEKMVRNMTILHLVSMALIFPTEALTGINTRHQPLQMTKLYAIAVISFRLFLGNNIPS
jgi:hypothetical protein